MPLLGSTGPVTVGSAADGLADALSALVESTTGNASNVIARTTRTRIGIAKLDGLIGLPSHEREHDAS